MGQQSQLAGRLKEALDQMTQEEFDKEWSKVTSLKLKSIPFTEAYFAAEADMYITVDNTPVERITLPDSTETVL